MKLKLLKKYDDVWNGIRDKIKEVSSGECDYEKYYMKNLNLILMMIYH